MSGFASTLARRVAQAAVPQWVWPFAGPAGWPFGSAFTALALGPLLFAPPVRPRARQNPRPCAAPRRAA
ncbi:hypothetical protein, partial [Burkholderia thailandensis]